MIFRSQFWRMVCILSLFSSEDVSDECMEGGIISRRL